MLEEEREKEENRERNSNRLEDIHEKLRNISELFLCLKQLDVSFPERLLVKFADSKLYT